MNALTCTLLNCTNVEVPLSKAGIQQLLLLGDKQHDNMVVVVRKKNSRRKWSCHIIMQWVKKVSEGDKKNIKGVVLD